MSGKGTTGKNTDYLNDYDLRTFIPIYHGSVPQAAEFCSSLSITDSDDLTAELCDTCNPRSAANRLEDLLSGDTASVVNEILKSHAILPIFLATISGSRFLFSILMRRPSIMEAFFLHKGYMVRKIRSTMERELRYRIDGLNDVSEVDRALRLYKEEEFLRIGCRDLAGLADVQEIMAELSDLAAASRPDCNKFPLESSYCDTRQAAN